MLGKESERDKQRETSWPPAAQGSKLLEPPKVRYSRTLCVVACLSSCDQCHHLCRLDQITSLPATPVHTLHSATCLETAVVRSADPFSIQDLLLIPARVPRSGLCEAQIDTAFTAVLPLMIRQPCAHVRLHAYDVVAAALA